MTVATLPHVLPLALDTTALPLQAYGAAAPPLQPSQVTKYRLGQWPAPLRQTQRAATQILGPHNALKGMSECDAVLGSYERFYGTVYPSAIPAHGAWPAAPLRGTQR